MTLQVLNTTFSKQLSAAQRYGGVMASWSEAEVTPPLCVVIRASYVQKLRLRPRRSAAVCWRAAPLSLRWSAPPGPLRQRSAKPRDTHMFRSSRIFIITIYLETIYRRTVWLCFCPFAPVCFDLVWQLLVLNVVYVTIKAMNTLTINNQQQQTPPYAGEVKPS